MNIIDFQLGNRLTVRGCIHDTTDARYLREDEMEIDLPSGITISVAWDHESGPSGRFAVVAFRDDWENREMTMFANDAQSLRKAVSWMIRQQSSVARMAISDDEITETEGVYDFSLSSPSRGQSRLVSASL